MSSRGLPVRPGVALAVAAAYFVAIRLLAPANSTDVDDAMEFAHRVHTEPYASLVDERYLLYLPLMRAIWALASLAAPVSSFDAMSVASSVFAAGAVGLFWLLARGLLGLERSAGLTTALLACSFGFLRFATVPDVYALISCLLLVAFAAAFALAHDRSPTPSRGILAGLAAGLPVWFYKPAAVLALVLMVFAVTRRVPRASRLAYVASAAASIGLGFLAAAAIGAGATPWRDLLLAAKDGVHFNPQLSHVPRALFSLGSDLVAMGWVFGHPSIVSGLSRVFPDKIVVEEVFAAKHAGWLALVPLATLPVLAVSGLRVLLATPRGPLRATPEVWALVGWIAAFGGMLVALDPSSVEPWTLVLPPLVLLAGLAVLERTRARIAAVVLVAALAAHNGLAGIGIVFSADGDYYAVLVRPVADAARAGDLLLTTNRKLARYVVQETSVEARNVAFYGPPSAEDARARAAAGGRLLVADDVASPPKAVLRRHPERAPEIAAYWERIRPLARVFSRTPAGTIYVIEETETAP